MATVESYETANGRRYRVRYRTPDNKQTSKRGFKTKKEALLFGGKLELDIAHGEYVAPSAGRVTVGQIAPEWLKKKRSLKPSAYAPLESSWRVYVEPRWGDVPLSKVTATSVETWLTDILVGEAPTAHAYEAEKGKPKSATTALRALGVLAGVLDMAVKDKRITKNPARGTEGLPKKGSMKQNRYLSHIEVENLAAGAPGAPLRALVLTLAYTGLRWGEAGALRVRSIDFQRSRVSVTQSATWVQRVLHVGPVKSWEKRTVPIPAFLVELLQEECRGKASDALVFEDPHYGEHLRQPDLRSDRNGWWTVMCRATETERLTPHDLRHTYASLAVSSGANVKALQRALGHKSAAMTLDIYADLFDADLDQVATGLDQGRSGAVVSKMCPPDPAASPSAT